MIVVIINAIMHLDQNNIQFSYCHNYFLMPIEINYQMSYLKYSLNSVLFDLLMKMSIHLFYWEILY